MTDSIIATGQAGSKVILLGEHAVVHGTDALAVGLPGGTAVTARPADGPLQLEVPAWQLCSRVDGKAAGDRALRDLAAVLSAPLTGIALFAEAAIPPRAGLGSSASLAAACAIALCRYRGGTMEDGQILSAIHASERVFHTNPSGVDAAAVLHPGCLQFNRKTGHRMLAVSPPRLVVVFSGKEGATGEMVTRFARRMADDPAEGDARVARVQSLVEEGMRALQRGDWTALGQCMNENHTLLQWFGVSCPELDDICRIALRHGAAGAKLTGGGGGGCAIVLVDDHCESAVTTALRAAGYRRI